ncbi:zinc-dependent alcohol dehydrogenase [Pedobacter heparinus]|uniref:zinc-dependent alcohol dehydrogenase n=1 Tax=Pedobacter heparinus TaxID=984 RepID=UPI00292DDFE6|nr:alcohol dehydrogenase catalytic domain-containing protein [Pedobacter heparinus]
MKQYLMTEPGKIETLDVAVPGDLKDNEVLLEIQRIGICGSDIHVYHGKHPFTSYPVVQGHEYSGKVIKVGNAVTKVKPGMKATARPQLVCGQCNPCKRGQYNVCQQLKVQGFQAPGCASEYFIVTEERILPLPEELSYEQGALVEPAAVAAHATNRVADLTGKNVVVSGAGTIGNLVAQFAVARGAAKVLITDFSDFRLGIAGICGVHEVANLKTEKFSDAVSRTFGAAGFQIGFEAVGAQSALNALVGNIENGGSIVIIGVYEQHPVVDMGFVGEHELNLFGSMMYKQEDYVEAIKYIAENRINTSALITNHFPAEGFLAAYKMIDQEADKVLKVMIDMK